ncbi:hypothetical protein [Blastococcus sp. SYSU D00820]
MLLAAGVAVSACGGGDDASADAESTPSVVTETVTASPSTQPVAPPPASSTAPAPTTAAEPVVDFVMPNLVGVDLQTAQNTVQQFGVFYSVSHDLLGSRNQVVDSNWIVCTQNVPAGQQVTGDVEGQIDFGVVKREERCP